MYNAELEYIKQQEQISNTFVIRPSREIKVGKMEKDLNKVKQLYELGRSDALANLEKIKAFFAAN